MILSSKERFPKKGFTQRRKEEKERQTLYLKLDECDIWDSYLTHPAYPQPSGLDKCCVAIKCKRVRRLCS